MGGKAMPVGYEKITVVLVLHTHIITHGAKIKAQVQEACRPNSA